MSANTATASGGCTFAGSGAPYTIQLQNQTYVMSTVNNYWYGPNTLPVIASTIIIEGNGATLAVTDTNIVRLRQTRESAPKYPTDRADQSNLLFEDAIYLRKERSTTSCAPRG
ncbi:MAG: hypothetical protein ACR2NN_20585 [Bryobacteraceae bacterium]